MRILAIRGQNLASLARPFELDLTVEPLAGSGLFAITGETGSGKSTILDALCLALYGQYPRVAVGRLEYVPDPSGKELSISDGRAILRRGAAAGFAEVDFMGHDGVGYRARWEVARARGKANGRLQNVQRSLRRLADDSAVAAGITSVLNEVVARTNLTFEQFRRTVLLAQGDFDLFLLAEERDRAELLEKITGTEIYGSISIRVREGTDKLRREIERLDQQRSDIGLLDDAARAALEQTQTALAQTISNQEAERGRLSSELEKRRGITAAQENLRLAQEQLNVALKRRNDAQEQFRELAEFEAVEPLRSLYLLAEDASKALPAAEQKVTDTERKLNSAADASRLAQTKLAEAEEAARNAEAAFKSFGPAWTEAEHLDAMIVAAQAEAESSERNTAEAAKTLKDQEARLNDLQRQLATATREFVLTSQELEKQSGHAVLAERSDGVLALLEQHEEQLRSCRAAEQRAAAAKKTVETLLRDVTEAEEHIQIADELRKKLVIEGDALRDRLNILNEGELQNRVQELTQLVLDLREAHRVAGRATEAAGKLEQAERERDQAITDERRAHESLDVAKREMERDAASRARLVPLDDLAQQGVSEQAAHLRSFLLAGQACPVCGAVEHPYRDAADTEHLTDALEALAESLRNQRLELDATINRAAGIINETSAQSAAAGARARAAVQSMEAARLESANEAAEFGKLRPSVATALAALGLMKPLPDSLEPRTQEQLTTLGFEAKESLTNAKALLADTKEIRTQLDAVRKQEGEAQTQFETQHRIKQERITQYHAAELELQRHSATQEKTNSETQTTERELLPFLASASIELEMLHKNASGVRVTISSLVTAYRQLKERAGSLEDAVRELEPKLAEASTILQANGELHTRCQADLTARNAALEERRGQRAALLGGAATATHRTRFNDERLAAIENQNSASATRNETASAHQGAVVAHQEAATALEEARARAGAAKSNFSQACAAAEHTCDWVVARLAVPAVERTEMQMRLQQIELAFNNASTNIKTRSADLEIARAGVDEHVNEQELKASLGALNEEIRGQQQQFGENAAELRRDEQARTNAQTLAAEIDAKRTVLTVWQAVDDAIGSPDGSRFRKFVQGITLGHLVRLANDHLSALGPRYRLAQGITSDLAVHVVDRDMANELRASRSLSGGERFLVSLSLALALSGLEGRSSFVDTLFIDEGFGSLDRETLDVAIDALESLHSRGRKVAIVTHVAAMIDRIAVQVRVEKLGGGHSVVRLTDRLDS